MLELARNVILERSFLLQINAQIAKPLYDDRGILISAHSPFLITKNLANRSVLVVNKVVMKKGVAPAFTITQTPLASNGNLQTSQGNQKV